MWRFVHHLLIIHGPLQLHGLLRMVFLPSLMTPWKQDGTKETAVKENTQLERELTQVWKWVGLWIRMKESRQLASWKVGSGPQLNVLWALVSSFGLLEPMFSTDKPHPPPAQVWIAGWDNPLASSLTWSAPCWGQSSSCSGTGKAVVPQRGTVLPKRDRSSSWISLYFFSFLFKKDLFGCAGSQF